MRLYNTLTRSIEEFTPLAPPAVTMYVCGPTVYDVPHLGHARSAYVFDVLRRYLEYRKFQVTFVRNVTDVDDKIITKAREEVGVGGKGQGAGDLNAKCAEVAERYLKSYHETLDTLGIRPPDLEPKATEHVNATPDHVGFGAMTDLISKLLIQGVAYEAKGDVYFSVRKFEKYGQLSNRTIDELKSGTRVEPGEQKEDPLDFALWKSAKPGEPHWSSPWGEGRPGWHIECSTMSTKYLGDTFDIHGGGLDLIFPHHENEIAQAQAAGKPFARYWVHNGLLTINGEKMSKSLGNYTTLDNALEQAGHPDALKLFFLSAHYRSPLDYSQTNIEAAGKRFDGLYAFLVQAEEKGGNAQVGSTDSPEVAELRNRFDAAMDNDLNTPEALAVLDELMRVGYRFIRLWEKQQQELGHGNVQVSASQREFLIAARSIRDLGQQLGITFSEESFGSSSSACSSSSSLRSSEINELFKRYKVARARKDYTESDALRREIQDAGFVVQDTAGQSILIPKR